MNFDNIYLVYRTHLHDEEDLHRVLVAKFFLNDNSFYVLEDHADIFKGFEKKKPAEIAKFVHALSNSMHYEVVNLEDVRQGQYPELVPTHEAPQMQGPESKFEYHRTGMAEPQVLEFLEGKAYLDGHLLSDEDLQTLLDNVQQGNATLGYHEDREPVLKAEEYFMGLSKIEPHLDAALSGLREAVKSGHVDPQVLKALTSEIFTDSMVKRVGNKKAYGDFLSRPKKGVHIRMDGNDFGSINKKHGFETGNQAISAMGNAIREAMDEAVGSKHGKVFRIGGDEFHAFVPDHEHAAHFARTVRSKLEAIPAVGGTHNLSLSLGFGHTPDHAELAMINAKQAKRDAAYPLGQAKTHAASQVPGFEGHIPTGPDQLNLKPLPDIGPAPTGLPHAMPAPQPHPSPALPAETQPGTKPGA